MAREPAFGAGVLREAVRLAPLDPDETTAPKAIATTLDPSLPAVRPSVSSAPAPRAAAPGPATYPPAAAPATKGSDAQRGGAATHDAYLNINFIPASTCSLDGRALGGTPRLHVEVSAGSHTVKFRPQNGGATKTVVVNVGTGETRLAAARLD